MNEIADYLNSELERKYHSVMIDGEKCFLANNAIIKITCVKGLDSIVVEYADNADEARKNRFEDGENFNIELGKEKILQRILEEIKM